MFTFMEIIVFAVIAVVFFIYGIRSCSRYLKFKKNSKHFEKVDATRVVAYSHPNVEAPDGYDYHYDYKYIYDGQEKIFKSHREMGKHAKLLYDKDNDKAYDNRTEASDMSVGRICILMALLIVVCFVVRFLNN